MELAGSIREELIAALDRRVPRVEQAGEAEIARDAARAGPNDARTHPHDADVELHGADRWAKSVAALCKTEQRPPEASAIIAA